MEVRSLEPVFSAGYENGDCARNPNHWNWTLLNNGHDVRGRYRHEAVITGDEILIIGGGTSDWTSSMDTSRLSHGCVKFGDSVYIHGGCTERRLVNRTAVRRDLFDDFWQLNLNSWCWQRRPVNLLQKVCFHGTTVTLVSVFFTHIRLSAHLTIYRL
ncbi:unnamed protein product [Gongylonema pulchrum]|uniref:Kelch domain-containing protein 10 n=1 Tax=Gongylonema pulchrum TaxID=637853 RepID=A0A183EES0_9BILA|nr:unnamed protein product [Gongylonema pulchrum]